MCIRCNYLPEFMKEREREIQAKRVTAEEEVDNAPAWWRIERFLWHQNLCEERKNMNIEEQQRAKYVISVPHGLTIGHY